MARQPGEILIADRQIGRRVADLAEAIASDLENELRAEGLTLEAEGRVIFVPVLTGAIVFVADLIRRLPVTMSIGMVSVSSYPGVSTRSKGASLRGALPPDLAGRHVVIVDDILDTGRTLSLLRDAIAEQGPASLRICALLRKDVQTQAPIEADYVGFEIPDVFVVGYGLDYDDHYRNLPDIRVLEPDEPEAET